MIMPNTMMTHVLTFAPIEAVRKHSFRHCNDGTMLVNVGQCLGGSMHACRGPRTQSQGGRWGAVIGGQ
jgi:hypothetical protein